MNPTHPASPWTAEREEIVRTMWTAGHSASQIAKRLNCGVSRNSVIGIVHRRGWAHRPKAAAPSANMKYRPGEVRRRPDESKAARDLRQHNKPVCKAPKVAREFGTAKPPRSQSKAPKAPRPVAPVLLSGHEKPWLEREPGECNWIVAGAGADSIACCAPVHARGWCAFHFQLGTIPETPSEKKRAQKRIRFWARAA